MSGAVVAALIGGFAAYEIQSEQPGRAASGPAADRRHTLPLADKLADGSRNAGTGRTTKEPAEGHAASRARTPSATHQGGASKQSRKSSGSSTAKLRAEVQQNIASGNYLLAVGQYLVEKGYSRAAAAGIASCIDGESTGNPESVGTGGGGLIGWTPISSAQPNPNIITGNVAHDMMTQLADLLYYNSSEIGQSLVNQLNGISDPVAAADFFSLNFEKPAVTYSDVRSPVAQQIFSELGG